ncbi:hypothetical protein ACMWQU_28060, partial [Escherichia coli]|uniref:hypothetical protein n=1 Tax=Escherichia coli TaxID=562 RepID=UPI0039DFC042
ARKIVINPPQEIELNPEPSGVAHRVPHLPRSASRNLPEGRGCQVILMTGKVALVLLMAVGLVSKV